MNTGHTSKTTIQDATGVNRNMPEIEIEKIIKVMDIIFKNENIIYYDIIMQSELKEYEVQIILKELDKSKLNYLKECRYRNLTPEGIMVLGHLKALQKLLKERYTNWLNTASLECYYST